MKKGSVLSETQFYTVQNVKSNGDVVVFNETNQEITLGKQYVQQLCNSAEEFTKVEAATKTQLADILLKNSNIAMTVAFYKTSTEKSAKAYKAEKQAAIDKITNATVKEVPSLLEELIENPITKIIPGDLRIMVGRHHGNVDDLGRVQFIDMEADKGTRADWDGRNRQVDPRTLQYIIVAGVKYELKK